MEEVRAVDFEAYYADLENAEAAGRQALEKEQCDAWRQIIRYAIPALLDQYRREPPGTAFVERVEIHGKRFVCWYVVKDFEGDYGTVLTSDGRLAHVVYDIRQGGIRFNGYVGGLDSLEHRQLQDLCDGILPSIVSDSPIVQTWRYFQPRCWLYAWATEGRKTATISPLR